MYVCMYECMFVCMFVCICMFVCLYVCICIDGPIPLSYGLLTSLKVLELSGTLVSKPIPSTIGNLIHLEFLDLSLSGITGAIPSSIGKLTALRHWNNYGVGTFGMFILIVLSYVVISFKWLLLGYLPTTIMKLTNLEYLTLVANTYSGIMVNRIPFCFRSINRFVIRTNIE